MNDHIRKIHNRVIKQWQIGKLIIAKADYGIDYYWCDRDGYLFTSSRSYITWGRNKSLQIMHGVIIDGKHYRFPRWWRNSRLASWIAGYKYVKATRNE